jgi:hypothetical protein
MYSSFLLFVLLGLFRHGTLLHLVDVIGQGRDHCRGRGEVGQGMQFVLS